MADLAFETEWRQDALRFAGGVGSCDTGKGCGSLILAGHVKPPYLVY